MLPLVAFAVGRILPYAVSPLLGSIQVPPDTPAWLPFGLRACAGLGFLAAPLVAYWLASPWFAELWPGLSPLNRGGALFVAMGAGIAAYLAGPLLLYTDTNPAIDVHADEHDRHGLGLLARPNLGLCRLVALADAYWFP